MPSTSNSSLIKMDVEHLRIGMYVVELDRPWHETAFLFQGFLLQTNHELRAVQATCKFVWVDSDRSHSVEEWALAPTPAVPQAKIRKVDFFQELSVALPAWNAAHAESLRILNAVQLGMDLDVNAVKAVVKECVDSILRNPAALLWLARIKNSDLYTAEHSLRVAIFAIALGRELGMLPLELEEIGVCGMLHDVGKIKVPSEILNKPGALTAEELVIMKMHADHGRRLLLSNQQVTPATVDVAYAHHERLDGHGYPRGLDASRIPYSAKIVAVVDAYDAINSDRIYSKGKSSLESLRILFDAAGSHFDEDIVGTFIRLIGIYPPGEIVELSSGEVAIIIGCPPDNKLKPRLLVVLDAEKKPCTERVIDLGRNPKDSGGRELRVREVACSGSFGIDIEAYRRKGLIIP
ncbi:HD-GYP domain-containing protein [Pseudomonas sp. GV071]|uniref:HD-GYP domain-containing protein n=1 Tax=Pseudomonas sp. GV071 TaxID=2135754 RepID=UPI000D33B984|nr:HD-GYP domain-containing protein [Pseudomonas sp. GV071]PTQ70542.1 HD-GYP domain-containing protein (c-di-GMP phosphodiesterase class II) [Pseudomonas sp. GV071]